MGVYGSFQDNFDTIQNYLQLFWMECNMMNCATGLNFRLIKKVLDVKYGRSHITQTNRHTGHTPWLRLTGTDATLWLPGTEGMSLWLRLHPLTQTGRHSPHLLNQTNRYKEPTTSLRLTGTWFRFTGIEATPSHWLTGTESIPSDWQAERATHPLSD